MRKREIILFVLLLITIVAVTTTATAAVLDLTSLGASGYLNNGFFKQGDSYSSTGTGVIDPFVRIQKNGIAQGYNTDYTPYEFDQKVGSWTHSLQISDIPVVTIGNVQYREFLLDINENSGGNNELLSLDKIQIYLGNSGNLHSYLSGLGTKIWDFDLGADGNSWIKMNYELGSGSGSGDMFAYIPSSLFTGPNQYVYLYSQFGAEGTQTNGLDCSDGFEEWAVRKATVVPEPSSMLALTTGLLSLTGIITRKRR